MGQQQLFIYILVVFIVGVVTVIAINTMRDGHESANMDAVREDILFSLQEAQQYYLTHKMMDGGGRSFDGISQSRLSQKGKTGNGTYAISGVGDTITIEGWGNYESIYLKAVGVMQPDGRFDIEWTHGFEEE